MKTANRVLFTAVVIMAVLVAVGAVQNYFAEPTRGCTRVDSAEKYWRYDCEGRNSFYMQK